MRKVYPSKASFSQYLPSMLTKIPWGLWGMRAEAHNIAIAWMQSVAVALIWWQSLVDLRSVLADPANFWGPGSLVLMIITFPTTIIISNMSNDLPGAHSKSDFLALLAVKSAQSGAIWYLSCVHNRRCLALCHSAVVMTNRNWSKQWHCRWRGVNIVVLRQFRMFLGKRPRASIQQLVTPWPPCSPPRMGTGQQKGCLAQKLLAAGNDWRKRTSEGGAKTWFVPRYLALTKDVIWRCQRRSLSCLFFSITSQSDWSSATV